MDDSCVDCFCNGFSGTCVPDTGWYQAQVQYSASDNTSAASSAFTTDGIKEVSRLAVGTIVILCFIGVQFPSI